jgi:hypothetical protein
MHKLFNIQLTTRGEPGLKAGQPEVPVFTAGQTVVTLPVASALISVVYQVLGKVFPDRRSKPWVPLVLGLLAGAAIYFQSAPKATTIAGKIAEAFFALLNSITLAAAALGIKDATSS